MVFLKIVRGCPGCCHDGRGFYWHDPDKSGQVRTGLDK